MPGISFSRNDAAGAGAGAVAPVGTTLSGSPTLTYAFNTCTAAAGNVAVALPQNASGPVMVKNTAATAVALTVFPPTAAGAINGGTAGAALSMAQNAVAVFMPLANGVDWVAITSA